METKPSDELEKLGRQIGVVIILTVATFVGLTALAIF